MILQEDRLGPCSLISTSCVAVFKQALNHGLCRHILGRRIIIFRALQFKEVEYWVIYSLLIYIYEPQTQNFGESYADICEQEIRNPEVSCIYMNQRVEYSGDVRIQEKKLYFSEVRN